MIMKNNLLMVFLGAAFVIAEWGSSARGEIVILNPTKDNSIYSENNNSNGTGNLFSGRINTGFLRRALLEFNFSSIPSGSTIDSVSLGLTQLRSGAASTAETFELHRVSAAWGEGTSSGTGQGSAATPGDATWNFRQFSATTPLSWASPGGDFGATSGIATIAITNNTVYTFSSQSGMVADVQNWVNSPASNFGWILKLENETINRDARAFGSRESAANQRPSLTVNFTAVPEPGFLVLLGAVALVASAYRSRRSHLRRVSGNKTLK